MYYGTLTIQATRTLHAADDDDDDDDDDSNQLIDYPIVNKSTRHSTYI